VEGALPRPRPHDWDVAGADVILNEAGALLIDARGQILHYNRESMRHGALLAFGVDLAPPVIKAARAAFGDQAA
jgi:myo-inositol-1(or 4)-monophosphatase